MRSLILAAIAAAGTPASAQTPYEMGKLMYGVDMIGMQCGMKTTPRTEAGSDRAFSISNKEYDRGYWDGHKVWDPRLQEMGQTRFCEKYGPMYVQMGHVQ